MALVLSYDRPIYVESHPIVPAPRLTLATFLAVCGLISGGLTVMVLAIVGCSSLAAMLWFVGFPALPVGLGVAIVAFRHRTVVFADRVEVGTCWGGLQFRHERMSWQNMICWQLEYVGAGIGSRPNAIRLLARSGRDVVVRSSDPLRLAQAIQDAQQINPAVRPLELATSSN